jgi:hypothetical protein
MKLFLLAIFCCTNNVMAADLMERWPESKHEWRVVEQSTSADGKAQTVVVSVPGGIFPAAIRLQDPKIDRVILRLQNIRMTEGISFQAFKAVPAAKEIVWKDAELEPMSNDLKTIAGFTVTAQGKDQVLEFTDKALDLLRRGGRFQFIDAYRR